MGQEIKLSGGDISVLKALGLSGSSMKGELLMERVAMGEVEFIETINGLIDLGYVMSTKVNIQKMEDVERSLFRVNASDVRDLRDAMRPGRRKEEDRPRRRRTS
jgi:hypothetical protein